MELDVQLWTELLFSFASQPDTSATLMGKVCRNKDWETASELGHLKDLKWQWWARVTTRCQPKFCPFRDDIYPVAGRVSFLVFVPSASSSKTSWCCCGAHKQEWYHWESPAQTSSCIPLRRLVCDGHGLAQSRHPHVLHVPGTACTSQCQLGDGCAFLHPVVHSTCGFIWFIPFI